MLTCVHRSAHGLGVGRDLSCVVLLLNQSELDLACPSHNAKTRSPGDADHRSLC